MVDDKIIDTITNSYMQNVVTKSTDYIQNMTPQEFANYYMNISESIKKVVVERKLQEERMENYEDCGKSLPANVIS